MRKLYKPVVYQISEYLECQFMIISSNIHQMLHLLPLIGPPIGALIFANVHPHSLKMLPTKFG